MLNKNTLLSTEKNINHYSIVVMQIKRKNVTLKHNDI